MSDKKDSMKELNPQIQTIMIGTRTLREITIYPLSLGDQLKLSDLIYTVVQKFFIVREKEDISFIKDVLSIIEENIDNILKLVVDASIDVRSELTNDQIVSIAEIIYDVNYDSTKKKILNLVGKVKS